VGYSLDEDKTKAALVASGIISEKLLDELEKTSLVQEAIGDHYDITEVRGGKLAVKQRQSSGNSNKRDNLNALLMAIDTEMNGPIVNQRPGMAEGEQGPIAESKGDRQTRMALTDMLSDGAISELAKPGLRGDAMTGMPKEQRLSRAVGYGMKLNNGYDHLTGSRLTMGLDGGHIFPHNAYPTLSTADFNIAPENKYVNRAKGDREGAALIQSLTNSFKKKFGPASKAGPVGYSAMPNLWNIGRGFD